MPPIILLNSLSKHFKVPVRESGLKASFGSLVKCKFRNVKAVDEITLRLRLAAGGSYFYHPGSIRCHHPGRCPNFSPDPAHPGWYICPDNIIYYCGAPLLAPGIEKLLRGVSVIFIIISRSDLPGFPYPMQQARVECL